MNYKPSRKYWIKKENRMFLGVRDSIEGEDLGKIIPIIRLIDEWEIRSVYYFESIVPIIEGKIELTARLVYGIRNNRLIYDPRECGKTWFRYIMSPKNNVTWAPIDYMEVRLREETMEAEIIYVMVLSGRNRLMGCEKIIPKALLGLSDRSEETTVVKTVKIGKLTVTP